MTANGATSPFHHGFGEGRLTTPKPVGAEVNTCDGFRFASLFDG